MNDAPTLIIYAEEESTPLLTGGPYPTEPSPRAGFDMDALATLQIGIATGLPIRFVAPRNLAETAASLLPATDIVDLSVGHGGSLSIKRGPISAGVLASAQSTGWLFVPADMSSLQPATLSRLCEAMPQHLLVYPLHHGQRGRPLGFSSEFFSELIRLHQAHDLSRLLARYPASGIEIDDPGLLTPVGSVSARPGPASQRQALRDAPTSRFNQ